MEFNSDLWQNFAIIESAVSSYGRKVAVLYPKTTGLLQLESLTAEGVLQCLALCSINMYFQKQAELEALGVTGAKAAEADKQLHTGSTPSVDEIHPNFLKDLDVSG